MSKDFRINAVQENFVCHIEANARRYGNKTVLVWDSGSLTWSELDRLASGFARQLASRGVQQGDRVAIVLPNRWDFVVAFMGVLKLGATPAPLNPLLNREGLSESIADLKPKLVVEKVEAQAAAWKTESEAKAPALILYTSGSTGRPKGAVFNHNALSFAIQSWSGPVMGLTPEDRVLATLPVAHSLGLKGGLLAPLLSGATVALMERFTPEAVCDAIPRHRVSVFPGVATVFRRVLDSAAFCGADFSSLRLAISGAAPCPWELATEWRDKTSVRILRGYGATEVPRPISYYADDPTDLPDAVGKAVPGVEVRLAIEDGGLHRGDEGELMIASPAAMDGYLDDPEETRAVLADGWFKTGDLAALSRDGYVRIVGRKRERILRGGYSVFPQEVETVLLSHPAVAEAAVVGIPSPDLGEEVAAFVSLKPAARVEPGELLEYCKERLARFKYPRRVKIMKELPKGGTGKVLKSELAKEFS